VSGITLPIRFETESRGMATHAGSCNPPVDGDLQ
jgi:hypothetical protein